MSQVKKAWNGGSIEAAMQYGRERRDEMISQGATLCDECNGEGGTILAGVCQQCHGAGCIIPAEGLKIAINHRPYRIYRTTVFGLTLYDTQPTLIAAEASARTGQVEYPQATFSIVEREEHDREL
jgi:hypothetical protein